MGNHYQITNYRLLLLMFNKKIFFLIFYYLRNLASRIKM